MNNGDFFRMNIKGLLSTSSSFVRVLRPLLVKKRISLTLRQFFHNCEDYNCGRLQR